MQLLFMGTKKYPEENAYSQYLSANSGSSNAYTLPTNTNYYFDVSGKPNDDGVASDTNPSPLYGALDRFAQFFVEPLFLESTLDRELRAVESENKKNLQSDQWRLHQLEKSLSDPRHPYCHFATGNLESLKIQPESRGINVRDKFIEFYEKHYSANRMKLVVLGRESLDLLESWVAEFFSGIRNKNLPPNRWEDVVPFGPKQLGVLCYAKPVMEQRELLLALPHDRRGVSLRVPAEPLRQPSHRPRGTRQHHVLHQGERLGQRPERRLLPHLPWNPWHLRVRDPPDRRRPEELSPHHRSLLPVRVSPPGGAAAGMDV